jgi:hypothetical protein
MRFHSFLGVAVAAALSPAAMAVSTTLSPSQDNTLYQDPNGFLSNGAGPAFFAGTTSSRSAVRRGLVQFDLSSIPAGSTVTGATLTLFMAQTISGPVNVELHSVLASWGEGTSFAGGGGGGGAASTPNDATWIHRHFNTDFWVNPGGDFAPGASASQSVGGVGSYSWTSAGLIADVQGWVNGGPNFGWLVLGDESTNATAKRFSSREDSVNPPQLTIEYVVPAPASAGVLIGALGLAARRRRR